MTDLPPLPATPYVLARESDGYSPDRLLSDDGYSADQMRAYAAAAVERLRAEVEALRVDAERWRKLVANQPSGTITGDLRDAVSVAHPAPMPRSIAAQVEGGVYERTD